MSRKDFDEQLMQDGEAWMLPTVRFFPNIKTAVIGDENACFVGYTAVQRDKLTSPLEEYCIGYAGSTEHLSFTSNKIVSKYFLVKFEDGKPLDTSRPVPVWHGNHASLTEKFELAEENAVPDVVFPTPKVLGFTIGWTDWYRQEAGQAFVSRFHPSVRFHIIKDFGEAVDWRWIMVKSKPRKTFRRSVPS